MRRPILALAFCAILFCAPQLYADPIDFDFNIVDPPGQGFNDPVLGPQRLAALEHAAQFWSNLIPAAYPGETLHVDISMDLPGNSLGSAGNLYLFRNASGLILNTWYGSSLANHLYGSDIDPALSEFTLRFSPNQHWYYGTDGQTPTDQYDFVTIAHHEIMHGLGINSRLGLGTGAFEPTNQPGIYDRFLTTEPDGGTLLINMTQAERNDAIRSGNLYWLGSHAVAANGGVRPKLWASPVFSAGRSITHLDASVFPDALMRAETVTNGQLGEVNRPSITELGMLRDLGWEIIPEPGTAFLFTLGWGILAAGRPGRCCYSTSDTTRSTASSGR